MYVCVCIMTHIYIMIYIYIAIDTDICHDSPITSWWWSHLFMANRWGNSGNTDMLFLGSKITADGDCSHEIKKWLLLGRRAMTNLDSILKSRDITLLSKVHMVKAVVFPVVIYWCESWTEHQIIDAFELQMLEKTFESALDCKEI